VTGGVIRGWDGAGWDEITPGTFMTDVYPKVRNPIGFLKFTKIISIDFSLNFS
jgi:hypothetical protein